MDTQDTGTTEDLVDETSTAADETVTDDTSTDAEDADYKRAVDKKVYLADLDRQIKEKEADRNKGKKREAVTEDQDDVMTWMTLNTDSLKLVGKEFQQELAFYKLHKIPVNNEIRDRALRDAQARKGVRRSTASAEADRQASTSSETTGETRKTVSRDVPESIKKLVPTMTPEQYARYKAEEDARKKR